MALDRSGWVRIASIICGALAVILWIGIGLNIFGKTKTDYGIRIETPSVHLAYFWMLTICLVISIILFVLILFGNGSLAVIDVPFHAIAMVISLVFSGIMMHGGSQSRYRDQSADLCVASGVFALFYGLLCAVLAGVGGGKVLGS